MLTERFRLAPSGPFREVTILEPSDLPVVPQVYRMIQPPAPNGAAEIVPTETTFYALNSWEPGGFFLPPGKLWDIEWCFTSGEAQRIEHWAEWTQDGIAFAHTTPGHWNGDPYPSGPGSLNYSLGGAQIQGQPWIGRCLRWQSPPGSPCALSLGIFVVEPDIEVVAIAQAWMRVTEVVPNATDWPYKPPGWVDPIPPT